MPERDDQERTEDPTPKRRQEAREKGQIPKSREVASVALLFSSCIYFLFLYKYTYQHLGETIVHFFRLIPNVKEMNIYAFTQALTTGMKELGMVLTPFLLLMVVVSLVANIGQVGFILTGEPLIPKLDKLNPISGIKNLFSKNSLVELVKGLLKIAIIGFVAYKVLKGDFAKIFALGLLPVSGLAGFILWAAFKVTMKIVMVFVILAILDYGYQKWENEQQLKMSVQEVKEELKQMEGDPQIKAKIKQLQREMAQRRMMEEVPKADVVITNPTELAIALRYDDAKMEAPTVVAKGAGFVAQRIKDIASKHGVPIVENKPLAQTLYKAVEIGDEIPEHLYKAVAEVLAYVYSLKNRERRKTA